MLLAKLLLRQLEGRAAAVPLLLLEVLVLVDVEGLAPGPGLFASCAVLHQVGIA